MQGENRSRVPFDDRAALEELERLQKSIQEYRRRREEAEGAFEEFVGSFRKPVVHRDAVAPPAQALALPPRPAPAPLMVPALPPSAFPEPSAPIGLDAFESADALTAVHAWSASARAPEVDEPAAFEAPMLDEFSAATTNERPLLLSDTLYSDGPGFAASEDPPAAVVLKRTKRGTHGRVPLALGGIAVLIVAAVLITRTRNAPAEPSPAPSAAVVAPPVATAPPAPIAAPVAAPVVPPAEIRTLRRVWVRVLVDGNREVERELEADAHVSLPAGRAYVIRTGDAGAVHFLLKGQDQGSLGGEGIVVTRTFTAPER
jgi:Domain of unknown function (DUF4115)